MSHPTALASEHSKPAVASNLQHAVRMHARKLEGTRISTHGSAQLRLQRPGDAASRAAATRAPTPAERRRPALRLPSPPAFPPAPTLINYGCLARSIIF